MKRVAYSLLLLCSLSSAPAQGTYEALTNFSTGASSGVVAGTAGWSFTPQISIEVTHLGCLDYVVTPQGPVDIGLWTDAGTLLSSAVIYATNTLDNLSRYIAISPVFLNGGSTYRLGAYSPSGLFLDLIGPGNGSSTLSTDINLGASAVGTGGFAFPGTLGSNGSMLLAPNFRYDRVPEPGSTALFGLAAALFALRKRR
jgi:hypothetical protein